MPLEVRTSLQRFAPSCTAHEVRGACELVIFLLFG